MTMLECATIEAPFVPLMPGFSSVRRRCITDYRYFFAAGPDRDPQ